MKTQNFINAILLLIAGFSGAVNATTTSLTIQGYMRQSTGTAISNVTNKRVAFGICQNGVAVWGKEVSTVSITSGLFSVALSGAGTDLAGTAYAAQFTGCTGTWSTSSLNTNMFTASANVNGAITVHVYAVDTIEGVNPEFDITLSSVPSAWLADTAKAVMPASIVAASIDPSIMTNINTGINGQLVKTDATGLIDPALLPTIATQGGASRGANSDITSLTNLTTALTVGQGGTGATTATAARVNLSAAESGANSDITSLTNLTTALSITQGGTGQTSASSALAALGGAANGANSDITSLTNLTTALSIAQGGTGATSAANARTALSAAASGANSDIMSLTNVNAVGGTGTLALGSASTTLVNILPTGTNAALAIAANGSGTVTIGNTGTGNMTIGNTGAGSVTTIQSGTGKIKVGSTGIAFTAMGICTVSSTTLAAAPANKTCTGVPASTAVAVACSPNAAVGSFVVGARATGTADQLAMNASGSATAAAYTCMWFQ